MYYLQSKKLQPLHIINITYNRFNPWIASVKNSESIVETKTVCCHCLNYFSCGTHKLKVAFAPTFLFERLNMVPLSSLNFDLGISKLFPDTTATPRTSSSTSTARYKDGIRAPGVVPLVLATSPHLLCNCNYANPNSRFKCTVAIIWRKSGPEYLMLR